MYLFTSPIAIPVVAIGGVFLWMIIEAIVTNVRDIVKHRNEVELKQSMVDRGMSADEIERVLRASNSKSRKGGCG
jgi:hypothetical protein